MVVFNFVTDRLKPIHHRLLDKQDVKLIFFFFRQAEEKVVKEINIKVNSKDMGLIDKVTVRQIEV